MPMPSGTHLASPAGGGEAVSERVDAALSASAQPSKRSNATLLRQLVSSRFRDGKIVGGGIGERLRSSAVRNHIPRRKAIRGAHCLIDAITSASEPYKKPGGACVGPA